MFNVFLKNKLKSILHNLNEIPFLFLTNDSQRDIVDAFENMLFVAGLNNHIDL